MISRRAFLETAAAASLELFLAGCTPPQYERRDIPATEIKKESIKPLVDSLNMQEIAGFPLAADQSGINTTVLTDDREKISFDKDEFQKLFNQIPEIAKALDPELFGGQDRKTELIKMHTKVSEGGFSGYNLYIALPSNPHSCLTDPNSEAISVMPEDSTITNICKYLGRFVPQEDNTQPEKPVIESLILVTGSVDNNQQILIFPGQGDYYLNANQAVNSALFHEMIHLMVSFYTKMDDAEENLASEFERVRLKLIIESTLAEILPVNFIPATSSIQKLKILFTRPKAYELASFLGKPIFLS